MRTHGLNVGYDLGHFPVPHGAGACQRDGCLGNAERATVLLVPVGGGNNPKTDLLILWLCWPCALAAERAIHAEEKAAAAS